jgi:hypothetical protein
LRDPFVVRSDALPFGASGILIRGLRRHPEDTLCRIGQDRQRMREYLVWAGVLHGLYRLIASGWTALSFLEAVGTCHFNALGQDIAHRIGQEIERIEREIEALKRAARRNMHDSGKLFQINERLRSLHVRLDEVRLNLRKLKRS